MIRWRMIKALSFLLGPQYQPCKEQVEALFKKTETKASVSGVGVGSTIKFSSAKYGL